MRQKLIVANWKMNGTSTLSESLMSELLARIRNFQSPMVVICPPFVYLQQVASLLSHAPSVSLGAQNCSVHANGAHTGEVSSSMLKDAGCQYVICGHSERRQMYGETDAEVAGKAMAIVQQQMTPIVCVGETLADRRSNRTQGVIERQMDAVLERCDSEWVERLVIAYEPIWAIGSGKSAAPEQAQKVHQLIRRRLGERNQRAADRCRVLYGGSVTDENAPSILEQSDIDGCLVGGASLQAIQFTEICRAAQS